MTYSSWCFNFEFSLWRVSELGSWMLEYGWLRELFGIFLSIIIDGVMDPEFNVYKFKVFGTIVSFSPIFNYCIFESAVKCKNVLSGFYVLCIMSITLGFFSNLSSSCVLSLLSIDSYFSSKRDFGCLETWRRGSPLGGLSKLDT